MKVLDQMNNEVEFHFPPKRVVSLVPSQSEFLTTIGLGERLVGVTKFCIHPESLKTQAQIVGGSKHFHIHKVLALKPDLVIGNMEENSKELIEELAAEVPVFMTRIEDVEDAFDMMIAVGGCCDLAQSAKSMVKVLKTEWQKLKPLQPPKRVAYLIWKDPWMAAGNLSYINDVLGRLGLINVFDSAAGSRYPEFSLEELSGLKPEEVYLSSEPYPFKEKHLTELQKVLPETTLRLVDGEMFSWYGSRMKPALAYFRELLKTEEK